MRVLVVCQCGTEFTTTEKRKAAGRGRFCIAACRAKFSNIGLKRSQYVKRVVNSGWQSLCRRCHSRYDRDNIWGASVRARQRCVS